VWKTIYKVPEGYLSHRTIISLVVTGGYL